MEADFDPERLERIFAFLTAAIADGQLPGAAIQLGRGGRFLMPRAFGRMGVAVGAPAVQPDTIFLTASVTKPVTVTAVMLLVERGICCWMLLSTRSSPNLATVAKKVSRCGI